MTYVQVTMKTEDIFANTISEWKYNQVMGGNSGASVGSSFEQRMQTVRVFAFNTKEEADDLRQTVVSGNYAGWINENGIGF